MAWEFELLSALQRIHTPWLDRIMVFFTTLKVDASSLLSISSTVATVCTKASGSVIFQII